jgi:nucleotide-binding universal stress UspA family protein
MSADITPAPIVVGILDPEVETALLEYAGRLAATTGHPLRLVHVFQANVLFGDPILGLPGALQPQSMIIDDSAVGRMAEELLGEATAVARDVVAGAVDVSGELLRGHAAHVLIEESEDAHRVVIQRRGFSRIHRIFTGSISSRVAAHAHCPVTVVPEGWSAEGRTGVVVGVSDGKSDMQVLGHAIDEAARLGEPVTVLHGFDLLALHGELVDHATTRDWTARGESYLADLVEKTRDQTPERPQTPIATRVAAEAPADALVTASEQARVVVVGRASHLDAFPHLGGVTRALLREAACPVEVLPLPS